MLAIEHSIADMKLAEHKWIVELVRKTMFAVTAKYKDMFFLTVLLSVVCIVTWLSNGEKSILKGTKCFTTSSIS